MGVYDGNWTGGSEALVQHTEYQRANDSIDQERLSAIVELEIKIGLVILLIMAVSIIAFIARMTVIR